MVKLLYIYFTYKSIFNETKKLIHNQMKIKNITDYIIVTGNETTYYDYKQHTLFINVNDGYDGLPEKIIKTFKFISESPFFDEYSHYLKLDKDVTILKKVDVNIYKNLNYGGNVQYIEGKRDWHFNKCPKSSHFYNKIYTGKFIPWCKGGYGYIISKNAVKLIKDDFNYKNHIYEDLYIALLLKEKNIDAIYIPIRKYIKPPDHNAYG
jgi:hypothetical protein